LATSNTKQPLFKHLTSFLPLLVVFFVMLNLAIIPYMRFQASLVENRKSMSFGVPYSTGNVVYTQLDSLLFVSTQSILMAYHLETGKALWQQWVNFTPVFLAGFDNHLVRCTKNLVEMVSTDTGQVTKTLYLQELLDDKELTDENSLEDRFFSINNNRLCIQSEYQAFGKDDYRTYTIIAIPSGEVIDYKRDSLVNPWTLSELEVVDNLPYSHQWYIFNNFEPEAPALIYMPRDSQLYRWSEYLSVYKDKERFIGLDTYYSGKSDYGYNFNFKTKKLTKLKIERPSTNSERVIYKDFVLYETYGVTLQEFSSSEELEVPELLGGNFMCKEGYLVSNSDSEVYVYDLKNRQAQKFVLRDRNYRKVKETFLYKNHLYIVAPYSYSNGYVSRVAQIPLR